MRIITLLACATTHALLARPRRPPAKTNRYVKDDTDTSNFDPYPDSVTEAAAPVFQGKDPFAEF